MQSRAQKLEGAAARDWYAAAALEHGWTRDMLTHRITSRLHTRAGAAPSNFTAALPPADSELAQAMVRDP
jgi:predicted nuclease of restriction endonuclease-like (RecB) superfamily